METRRETEIGRRNRNRKGERREVEIENEKMKQS